MKLLYNIIGIVDIIPVDAINMSLKVAGQVKTRWRALGPTASVQCV